MNNRRSVFTLLIILIAPLVMYAVAGSYSRAMADDYCYTFYARDYGVFGAIDYWYHTWTGIYSAIVLQGAVGVSGMYGLLPGLLVILWVLAATYLFYQLCALFDLKSRLPIALLAGAALVYTANTASPNIAQSLYWAAGSAGYVAPIVLITFQLALWLYGLRKYSGKSLPLIYLLFTAGITMILAGFSTLVTVFYGGMLILTGAITLLFAPETWKQNLLKVVGVNLIFTLIALFILGAAPGNEVRRAMLADPLPLPTVIINTLVNSALFYPLSIIRLAPIESLLMLILFGAIGLNLHPLTPTQRIYFRKHSLRWILVATLVSYLLICAAFFPAIYVFSAMPSARAYIVPQTVMMGLAVVWGYLMGLGMQQEYATRPNTTLAKIGWVVLGVIMIAGPLRTSIFALQLIPDYQTFAADWQVRNTILTTAAQQGLSEVTIPAFTFDLAHEADVYSADDNIESGCFQEYYAIPQIQIVE